MSANSRLGTLTLALLALAASRAHAQDAPPEDGAALAAWADERARLAIGRERFAEALAALDLVLARDDVPAEQLPQLALLAADVEQYAGSLARAEQRLEQAEAALDALGTDWVHRALFDGTRVRLRAAIANGRGLPEEAAAALAEPLARALERKDGAAVAEIEIQRANVRLSAQQHTLLERQVATALARPEFLGEERAPERARLRLCLGTSLAVRARTDPELAPRAEALLREVVVDEAARASDVRRARLRLAEVLLGSERRGEARETLAAVRADARAPGGLLPRDEERVCAYLEVRLAREEALGAEELGAALVLAEGAVERLVAALASEPPREAGLGLLHYGETRALLGEQLLLLDAVYGPAEGAERGLALLQRVQALGSRARRAGWTAVPNGELRSLLLGPGEGLLVYLPAIGASHVLAVDRQGARRFTLPAVERLNEAREAFDAAFGPLVPPEAWKAEAGALRELLLPEPLLERIEAWSALSIVGLDLVRPIPFERLTLADGRSLGDELAIAYLPSLPLGVELARRAPRTRAEDDPDLVLVAAPRFAPGELVPLAFGEAERERLTRGAARALVRSGAEATPAALAEPAVARARVLHVLTHGVFERTRPLPSGLALAADGERPRAFYAEDVEALPGVPPLVILSACKAARGPGRLGEGGLEGLVGALLERGADCVLVAFEDVELAAAIELVEVLQPLVLEGGLSPAAALRRAQHELAERRPDAPAAAPLQAFGLAQRPLR